jgi:hypothetical protein
VSRDRQVRVVTHVSDDGDERDQRLRYRDTPPALADTAPGRSPWLVEVLDPNKHRVAVLVANAGLEPLVYVIGYSGAPAFVLLPDGLAGALVTAGTVSAVGDAAVERPVFCPVCKVLFPLLADTLHAKRGPKPGKPGRFTLGASHSA